MDSRLVLRSLRGAPLSVVMALFMFGGGDRQDLIGWTGYQKGAIDSALRLLEEQGVVVRPSYKRWALSDGAQQLPLFNYPLNGQLDCGQPVDNPSNYPLNGQLVTSSSSSNTNKQKENTTQQPDKEILAVCEEVGIYGRKRQTLAQLDYVIENGAGYVRAHVSAVKSRDIGLAIWRMEEGWAAPDVVKGRPLGDQVPERYRDVVKR